MNEGFAHIQQFLEFLRQPICVVDAVCTKSTLIQWKHSVAMDPKLYDFSKFLMWPCRDIRAGEEFFAEYKLPSNVALVTTKSVAGAPLCVFD